MRSMSFFPTRAQFVADHEHSCGSPVPFRDAQKSQLCTPYRERLLSRGTAREIAVGSWYMRRRRKGWFKVRTSIQNRNATRSCFDLKEKLRLMTSAELRSSQFGLLCKGCRAVVEFRAVHWRYVSRPFYNLHGRVTALPSTEWPPHLLRWTQSLRRWWKMYVEHLPRMALLPTTRPIQQSFLHLSTFQPTTLVKCYRIFLKIPDWRFWVDTSFDTPWEASLVEKV